MLGSRNKFFYQSRLELFNCRSKLQDYLHIKGRTFKDIKKYIKAYDYFVHNKDRYDGATIVKDLVDIRNGSFYLDCDAMLHDYEYIVGGANKNFVRKWKSDISYIKNMEFNGKGIRVFRMIILTLMGLVFIPYKIITDEHV